MCLNEEKTKKGCKFKFFGPETERRRKNKNKHAMKEKGGGGVKISPTKVFNNKKKVGGKYWEKFKA